jgi:hypothetical protein
MLKLLRTLSDLSHRDARDYVITSGNDSTHSPNSRHYVNEAIDVRTNTFTRDFKRDLRQRFSDALGAQFSVIIEDEGKPNEHMHAQVRKSHVFQPEF